MLGWRTRGQTRGKREGKMLWTIFVILLVLWLLGLVSSYTLGGFIHILLVLALVVLVINLLSGRRTAIWERPARADRPRNASGSWPCCQLEKHLPKAWCS